MRHLFALALVLLLLIPSGCGGGGGSSSDSGVPAAATAMDTKLTSDMDLFIPRVPRFEGILVFILNAGPLAPGMTLTPDMSPGAQPFSYTFSGTYDGNEDGFDETTLSGRATFSHDPDVAWSSVTGNAVVDVAIPIVGQMFHANVNYMISSAERQISGSGTVSNPLTGNTTTMTIAAATPLVIKQATGAAGAVSNSCGYSLEGQMRFEVTGSSGTLKSTWNFSSNSASVAVNNRTFTDSSGQTTMLPDTTVDTPCGGGGTINDWVGTYTQQWACLPRESGQATITMSVTGPDTVTISDQDPPGSPPTMYTAMTIGGNPHALRGFFISGPIGFQYREDFNWTMRKSLSGFAQSSSYTYIGQTNGGLCVASAPRS